MATINNPAIEVGRTDSHALVPAPQIIPINPTDGATSIPNTTSILFNIVSEFIDNGTITVTINEGSGAVPAVTGGIIQSPYNGTGSGIVALTGSDAGLAVTLQKTTDLPANQLITVVVSVQDIFNRLATRTYTFTTVGTLSTLTPIDPLADQLNVPVNSNIVFNINDSIGLTESSILVTIATNSGTPITAISGGVFQSGFSGSIVANGTGFDVTIDPDSDLQFNSSITVFVRFINTSLIPFEGTYSFSTTTIPVLTPINPVNGQTVVAQETNVLFNITGPVQIDQSTLSVQITSGGSPLSAISAGAFVTGFTGTITANGLGFDVDINPDVNFPSATQVFVRVIVQDTSGGSLDETYSFFVLVVNEPPVITPINPIAGATAPVSTNVVFNTTDATGIDSSTINVSITPGALASPVVAVLNGVFQTGFDGPESRVISLAGGFQVVIDPIANFPASDTITVNVSNVSDLGDPPLSSSLVYVFNTGLTETLDQDEFIIETHGGSEMRLQGSIPVGFYRVHVGPEGTADDPPVHSGIVSSSKVIEFRTIDFTTGTTLSLGGFVYSPALPIGNSNSFTFVELNPESLDPTGTVFNTSSNVIVVAESFAELSLSYRRLLMPNLKTGPRDPKDKGPVQT